MCLTLISAQITAIYLYGAELIGFYNGDQSVYSAVRTGPLTLTLLTWRIWRAPTNGSKWWMGFNSALKGLNIIHVYLTL